jgi:hypothetical protein
MTRFFFHLSSKDQDIRDPNGRELGDLAAAHRHAVQLIHKIVVLHDMDWRGWSIIVADAGDQSVFSVLFPPLSYFPDTKTLGQLNRNANP